jgi:outer membrane protein assembly factor BamB
MRRLRLACVLGLVFVLGGAGEGAFATGALGFSGYAAARSAGEWPQFHFGPNLKGSNPFETILNPTTVGGLRQAWTLTTGFEIVHSSPAVAGGVAYIGSFDGKLHAADAVTGATLWTFVASDAINSAPAVAGGLVYFTSQGGGKVYALDAATGALRWSARVITDVFSDGLSVADGVVYVDGDSPDLGPVLSAFDAATGVIRWRAPLPSLNDSYPAVAGGRVYVVACGTLFALRATDGSTLWQQAIGGCGNSSPALAGGVVYVGGNSTLYALDAATGSTIWTRTSTTGVVFSTPAVAGDRVFVAMDGSDGEFTVARKAASGDFLWRANAAPRGPAASAIDSSVAVANGVVYMSANDSSLYAYNAKTGALLRRLSLGGQSFSSPAVADGRVYVGALDGKLYAFALP